MARIEAKAYPTQVIKASVKKLERLPARLPSQVIKAETSYYRLDRGFNPNANMPMKAVIKDDLKAGGNLPHNFVVQLTPKGVQVDVTK
ncbi:MAG: hypothetical protein GY863_14260 [bacterium]|nr:hypothetical protein [bacterium]